MRQQRITPTSLAGLGYDVPPPAITYADCDCRLCTAQRRGGRDWWIWIWVSWLVLFLVREIPAAITEGEHGRRTLSRFVWSILDTWGKRLVLIGFMAVLALHFVAGSLGVREWWMSGGMVIAAGVPMALVLARGFWRLARG